MSAIKNKLKILFFHNTLPEYRIGWFQSQYSATTSIPGTGLHTWQFAAQVGTSIGDKGSLAVARAIARACAEVWENPEVVKKAKEELLEATGGEYVSPIPDKYKIKT